MLDGKLVRHHVTQGQAEHMCADPSGMVQHIYNGSCH